MKTKTFSLPATLGFLLLAVGLVCGCVLVVNGMLSRQRVELPAVTEAPAAAATPAREDSSEAAAILVPEGGALPPSAAPAESPAPSTPSPEPTLTPTPMPHLPLPAFTKEQMDVVILGLDAQKRADAILVVSLRAGKCTVLSLPRNTVVDGGTLGDAKTPAGVFAGLDDVLPVRLKHYITLDMRGLPACVDAFGGVSLGGEESMGEGAAAFLEAGGSDELLRITRQQELLHALAVRIRQLGLLRLLSLKHTLQKYTDGNLSAAQYVDLYGALRALDTDGIRFLTLPVDSVVRDGRRLYAADRPLCEALACELFMPAD